MDRAPELVSQLRSALMHRMATHVEWFDAANERWIEQRIYPDDGGIFLFGRDVTERHRQMQEGEKHRSKMIYQAAHDALTGLFNRRHLQAEVDRQLIESARSGRQCALLFIGLDGFKNVNDSLSHEVGDQLLCQMAHRLRQCTSENEVLARCGDDEFAILHSENGLPFNSQMLVSRAMAAASRPFDLDGIIVTVEASIGIAIAPQDGLSQSQLFKAADIAMCRAKAECGNTWRRFTPAMQTFVENREAIRTGLHDVIAREQLVLDFQPMIDLKSGRVSSFEALVRWRHPEWGIINPEEFIAIAEESGTIIPIGVWILKEACREALNWPSSVGIAINLSARQFNSEIVSTVSQMLVETGLSPDRLMLEITETVLLDSRESNLESLRQFRELGVLVVLDDFGIGFSSLNYLQQFLFDQIKIDRSFIQGLIARCDKQCIVRSLIGLAHDLSIDVTAEGVETREQLEWLRAAGCDQVQGYFQARPMASKEALEYLKTMTES